MNYIDQFIQLTVQRYTGILKIKKPVFICTNKKEWLSVFPDDKHRIKTASGATRKQFNWIYLNLSITDHKSLLELEDTILHELLHLKFPEKKENQMQALIDRYFFC